MLVLIYILLAAAAVTTSSSSTWTSALAGLNESDLFRAIETENWRELLFPDSSIPSNTTTTPSPDNNIQGAAAQEQLAELETHLATLFPNFFPLHAAKFNAWSQQVMLQYMASLDHSKALFPLSGGGAGDRSTLLGLRAAYVLKFKLLPAIVSRGITESVKLELNRYSILVPCESRFVAGLIVPQDLWERRGRMLRETTAYPTPKPTTSYPTKHPTTSKPSRAPETRKPTKTPTIKQPTKDPTSKPTKLPTNQPTSKPSKLPTVKPTRLPTNQPTSKPSKLPIVKPTKRPTNQPSSKPSKLPTVKLTKLPTNQPTSKPSKLPTVKPTKRPTNQPTSKPSKLPTVKPTKRPVTTKSPTFENRPASSALEFDLRDYNAVVGVKDQGACGSCYAFAANAVTEGRAVMQLGATLRSLSEQQIVSCANIGDCVGGWMPTVWRYFEYQHGQVSSKTYPYKNRDSNIPEICQTNKLEPALVKTVNVDGYIDTILQLKQALLGGPIAVSIAAYNPCFLQYKGGLLNCECSQSQDDTNHAVTVVGWKNDYWIVKNSWGTGWGENGYARFPMHVPYPGTCGMFLLIPKPPIVQLV